MAQSFKCLTLGFSSSHDLMAHEFEPHVWLCTDSALTVQSVLGILSLSLSLSLSAPPPSVHALVTSLSQINNH